MEEKLEENVVETVETWTEEIGGETWPPQPLVWV